MTVLIVPINGLYVCTRYPLFRPIQINGLSEVANEVGKGVCVCVCYVDPEIYRRLLHVAPEIR